MAMVYKYVIVRDANHSVIAPQKPWTRPFGPHLIYNNLYIYDLFFT